MKEKNECKIVKDLLPSYIDDLLSIETKLYVEEHLKICKECQKSLNDMQKELEMNNEREKREVKYIKKISNKMRTLKCIILLIIVIFAITIGRKMIIISDLQNKATDYTSSTNFHRIVYSYEQDTYVKTEIFSLAEKKKILMTRIVNGEKTVTEMYFNGNTANIYTETESEKTARLNQKMQVMVDVYSPLQTENWWHLFIGAIPTSIISKECNGKECYFITNFMSPYILCEDGTYVDKETGLAVRIIATTETMTDGAKYIRPAVDYVHEFNTVTESDFAEPDINEYKIEK